MGVFFFFWGGGGWCCLEKLSEGKGEGAEGRVDEGKGRAREEG